MARDNFLICFVGIDGSGKTTLSKETVELLNKRGVKCQYVYARLNPLILRPFILIGDWLFLRGRDAAENYSAYSSAKRKTIAKRPFLSWVYQQILLFDYRLQILFKVKIPFTFGKNIVCDRYIHDTVITDLSVDMNYSKDKLKRALDNLFRFFPRPDITFVIDAPEEIAYQRKSDIPSIEYLKERRKIYLELGKEDKAVILDGSRTIADLMVLIQDKVSEETG